MKTIIHVCTVFLICLGLLVFFSVAGVALRIVNLYDYFEMP
ncbi:MAG TPA: hypothetical protein VJW77_00780 [Terriglobia bacterium]|nr:hypothetical protein [Terriglobia bacterium]